MKRVIRDESQLTAQWLQLTCARADVSTVCTIESVVCLVVRLTFTSLLYTSYGEGGWG